MTKYPPRHKMIKGCLISKKVYQCAHCRKYAAALLREQRFRPGYRDNFGEVSSYRRVHAEYHCHNCGFIQHYDVSWQPRDKYWFGFSRSISKEEAAREIQLKKMEVEKRIHLERAGVQEHQDPDAWAAYRPAGPGPARNPHIQRWWTTKHDDLIRQALREHDWAWPATIGWEIAQITPREVLNQWCAEDPLVKQGSIYFTLEEFAKSRAEQLGLTRQMGHPGEGVCLLCGNRFSEASLVPSDVVLLGIRRLRFCRDCLLAALNTDGDKRASRTKIKQFLCDFAAITEQVPTSEMLSNPGGILSPLSDEDRAEFLRILQRKPHYNQVKKLFGSWFHAIVAAGLLVDGTRRTARGTHTLAKDGHRCLSLAEKTIDDYLFNQGIPHEREVYYPNSNYRVDFKVGEAFIEYFGLAGDPEYDQRMQSKRDLCRMHQILLIELYPEDLTDVQKLKAKLSVTALQTKPSLSS